MKTGTFTTEVNLGDWYSVVDPGGVYYDAPGVLTENPPPPGGANGLVGTPAPWKATIVPAARYGRSRLTVEVFDSREGPPSGSTRIVERDFRVVSGEVAITEWGGELIHTLSIPSGSWRLRVNTRQADDMEEHLLQMWPVAQPLGEVVTLWPSSTS